MSKPIKHAIAVVLKQPDSHEFLVVRRPKDDPELSDSWGLPAGTMIEGELPEDTALRVCREKLGCLAEPDRLIGTMIQKRNKYDIVLIDIEMTLLPESQAPDVKRASTTDTAYTDQKWTNDPATLMRSAKKGSCCSSIFLADQGLLDREEWILSLEGSAIVG